MTRPFSTKRLPPDVWLPGEGTRLTVRSYRAGAWMVVELAGELDLETVPRAMAGIEPGPFLVFDVERLTFLDCSGLGLLAASARATSEAGGCVRVAGASRMVRKLVVIGGLYGAVAIYDSLQSALTAPIPATDQSATIVRTHVHRPAAG